MRCLIGHVPDLSGERVAGPPPIPLPARETRYQLRIVLDGLTPAIWRRFIVPGKIFLDQLHSVVQIVMGWENSHFHQFQAGDRIYSSATARLEGAVDEATVTLAELAPRAKRELHYLYDFGDDWSHTIRVEKIQPVPPGMQSMIRCLAGANACPREDSGGPPGYADILATAGQKDGAGAEAREWLGPDFDPDRFDCDAVNRELDRRQRRQR